jgi:hypothetical protein
VETHALVGGKAVTPFLCAFEAVNLDNLFSDCHDLSTTRGGGLAVLRLGEAVAKVLSAESEIELISASASHGIMIVSGASAESVEDRVRRIVNGLPLMNHATVMVAACDHHEDEFNIRLAQLKTRIRWAQMQSPSVVYPELHGHRVCQIDGIRPASRTEHRLKDKNKTELSAFTHERRQLGRDQKRALVDFPVVSDLNQIGDPGPLKVGNAAGKIAVLRFDGNGFGKTVESCGKSELKAFSQGRVAEQKNFVESLVAGPEWFTPAGEARLEVVVYGGDEVTIIVPAWLGWRALRTFYSQKFDSGITYGGGLVFCHSNAPIHSIKQLANELTDKAKEYAEQSPSRGNAKGNYAVYQPLESFDAIGRELDVWMAKRYPPAVGGLQAAILGIEEISILADQMSYWKKAMSKRKLYKVVGEILRGDPKPWSPAELNRELQSLLEAKGSSIENLVGPIRTLHDRLGKAAFLHILELWDYVGVDLDL